jgi:hypothetical protein
MPEPATSTIDALQALSLESRIDAIEYVLRQSFPARRREVIEFFKLLSDELITDNNEDGIDWEEIAGGILDSVDVLKLLKKDPKNLIQADIVAIGILRNCATKRSSIFESTEIKALFSQAEIKISNIAASIDDLLENSRRHVEVVSSIGTGRSTRKVFRITRDGIEAATHSIKTLLQSM